MASQSIPDETRIQLDNLLRQWSTRWRLRRVLLYLPRIIIAMCATGIITALVITTFSLLSAQQMLIVSGIVMAVTFALITGSIGFWRKNTMDIARQFDALFELQVRVSTALELLDGRIQASEEIAERQIKDTYEFAKQVDARKQIPLKVKWLEWLVAVIVLILTIVLLSFAAFTLAGQGNITGEATQVAIDSAADTARDITEELATDTSLSEEERNSLLESSEMTLNELENPDAGAEDSFVAMSELESDLREQAESIQDSAESSDEALQSAMDALNGGGQQSPQENPGEALAQELSELADEVATMNAEEQESLTQQLQEAADALREQNEALADALEQIAEQLQNNQPQDAQDALNQASQEAQSAAQQNQTRSETAEALQQAANQAQDAASQIAESERQDAQEQQSQQQQDGQQQDGQQAPGQPPQGGQQPPGGDQQGQQGQDGSQQGQEGQPQQGGEQAQPGDQGQQGQQGQPGQQSGEQAQQVPNEGDNPSLSEGGGAGNSDSTSDTQDITGLDDGSGAIGNTSNDGGETEYDALFAPDAGNVQPGDTTVELETDDSNASSIEGDFQENPAGESVVPYNQVFGSYADAANNALENGYVPLGVRDVVRDYFTSIEPTGNRAGE